jgi:flagellar motility protein MotE (MotC chaperone)
MSGYSLAQAAAAVGRNRSSILRAIKAGKISAVRDEATGEWRIEPAELHRLYPVTDAQGDAQGNAQLRNDSAQVEIRELRARLADKDDVIADLRQQRDQAQKQLAAAQERIAALLTDQRTVPARRWWRWR